MRPLLAAALFLATPALAQSQATPQTRPKTLFYMSDGRDSVRSFMDHRDKIDILSPTWYQLDSNGFVSGEPDPHILQAAHAANIQVFPLLAMFDKDGLHRLVGDLHAQAAMNQAIVDLCKRNGYPGIQFDIENVSWIDRDGFSALIKRSADLLHGNGLQVQIAVVPNAPGHAGSTPFSRWIFQDWRAAYDYKAIADAVDLFCLMTYDQNTRWTPPGPVGGWLWTNENLDYALAEGVPASKLSLGIALYGYHWYAGDPGLGKPEQHSNITADYISFLNAEQLRTTYNGTSEWDPIDHTEWFWFYRDQTREWVFRTDARGWQDRYNLAAAKHLQGTCAWILGEEDPALWATLPSRH